jgi:hypothetical protein
MLAYSIFSSYEAGSIAPQILVGPTPGVKFTPNNPQENSYWFNAINAQNLQSVYNYVQAGTNNTAVPPGLEQYISNQAYIVTLATQSLFAFSVPQGPLYAFLAKYGAGRELQRLEQMNTTRGCGQNERVSYVLTTQGGTFGYEQASDVYPVRYMMSLVGGGPYTLCDAYTFTS